MADGSGVLARLAAMGVNPGTQQGFNLKNIAPWLLALLPKALPAAATGLATYEGTKKLMQTLYPNDPYYAAGISSLIPGAGWAQPNPEMFYKQQGGAYITPHAQGILEKYAGGQPSGTTVASGATQQDQLAAALAMKQTLTPPTSPVGQQTVRWGSIVENGYVWDVGYDAAGNITSRTPVGQAESETVVKSGLTLDQARAAQQQLGEGYYIEGLADGTYRVIPDPSTLRGAQPTSLYEQEQLDLQRQQMEMDNQRWQQQLAAEREQRLATLKANPASWLEYAALANQPVAIQPWMLPLMPQQYQGLQAGAALPGWSGSADAQNLAQLTTPSAQYMARISPSAQQQYYGYEKARTGQTPEDTSWRLWSRAAPSGGFGQLTQTR